jgi:hypothetical protein
LVDLTVCNLVCLSTFPFCCLQTYSPSLWPTSLTTLQTDALNKGVSGNATTLASYIWTSHTFSHHNLHNATGNDSYKQVGVCTCNS